MGLRGERRPVYEVTILYKNGVKQKFHCVEFDIKGGRYSWRTATKSKYHPVKLGADDIAAVWYRLDGSEPV